MALIKKIGRAFGLGRSVCLLVLIGLLSLRVVDPYPVQILRNQTFDFFQRLQPRDYQPAPVAIVDIDEKSLREIGQWPWSRTKIADLIEKLARAGAVVTAFDMVFAEPDRLSPNSIVKDNPGLAEDIKNDLLKMRSNDEMLAEMMKRTRVVLGQTAVRRSSDIDERTRPIKRAQYALLGPDKTNNFIRFPSLVQNLPVLEEAASGRGLFTVITDGDNVMRKVPLVFSVEGFVRLTLSVELLRIATGGKAFAVRSNEWGISELIVAGKAIKTDHVGNVWPYFTPSIPARYISASDVLNDKVSVSQLRGKLVLVGPTAIGLEDYRATPLGVAMPGVEIHAQTLENILSGTLLKRPAIAFVVELLVIAALGLLVIALLPFLGAVYSALLAVLLLSGYAGSSFYAFLAHKTLLDPAYPVIVITTILILMAAFNYLREEQQRRQIRSAFGQYVSPALVDQLSDNPEQLTLGGETRDLSILFTDVRGFTTISESFKHNPAGLTVLMNRFLNVLSEAVLRQQGTIDKFMGDAVMAFWNAPLDHEKHAEAACLAALDMIKDVDALNDKAAREIAESGDASKQFHRINIGVGINSGTCVVGNMGSDARFDYTALGDAVNLASRLEGQSKPYGVGIVMGSATVAQVRARFAVFELDKIRVKGKTEPEQIFGLFGDNDLKEDEGFQRVCEINDVMLRAYRDQDWSAALNAADELQAAQAAIDLGIDVYVTLYRERIMEFQIHQPGRDWDGVYVATSK